MAEIVQQVMADGISPVICINPSHGAAPAGYDGPAVFEADVRFLQQFFAGVNQ